MSAPVVVHGHALRIPPSFRLIDSRPLATLHAIGKPVFFTIYPPTWDEPDDWLERPQPDGEVLERRREGARTILRLAKLRRVVAFYEGPIGRLPIALNATTDEHDGILDAIVASVDASPSDPSAMWSV